MSDQLYRYEVNDAEDRFDIYSGVNVIGSADFRDHAEIWVHALNHPARQVTQTMTTVRRQAHMMRFHLLDALPREDEESEGTQHALIAHALLQQVEHHLQLASMKGVR